MNAIVDPIKQLVLHAAATAPPLVIPVDPSKPLLFGCCSSYAGVTCHHLGADQRYSALAAQCLPTIGNT